MSNNLASAFNMIIRLQGRDMTYERTQGSVSENVRVANSNYFRNFAGLEEAIIEGMEFIVSKKGLDDVGLSTPERGDVLIDSVLGVNNITEVREMMAMGELVGYRLRTG